MKDKAKVLVRINWLFEASLAQFRIINNEIKKGSSNIVRLSISVNFIRKITLSNTLLKQASKEYNMLLRNNRLSEISFSRLYNLYIKRSGMIFQESLIHLNQMKENKLITLDFFNKINSLNKMMIELEKYFINLLPS